MDRTQCLIFLKDKESTEDISSLSWDAATGLYHVHFCNNKEKEYCYRAQDIKIHTPVMLNPEYYFISYGNTPFSGLTAIYRYEDAGYWYLVKGNRNYLFKDEKLNISHSILEDKKANDILLYLKEISFVNPITDMEGNRILAKRYKQIDFVNSDSILAKYISPGKHSLKAAPPLQIIYPFGCNKSQKLAVENALSNKLSIIQGPPGTGKTQTILTIISNLILQNKTVEIVSNNNSAVDNIKEKMASHGLSFLVASLGSTENKEHFIESQSGTYPDISSWEASDAEIQECISEIKMISKDLYECYETQEERQKKITELSELDTESIHFSEMFSAQDKTFNSRLASREILSLLQKYNAYFKGHEYFSLPKRLIAVFISRAMTWKASASSGMDIITRLQWQYYCTRKKELQNTIDSLESKLNLSNMADKQERLSRLSQKLLRAFLFNRLKNKIHRPVFTEDDFWRNPESIVKEYPVVTSTAFSSSTSLKSFMYDYVIIDESSQCDIATGALSLASAKNAVIVGDTRQLQNVVTENDRDYTDSVFQKYDIPEEFRYSAFSFLSSILAVFPDAPKTMLCEHYRCQPKIIGFCNEKFYDNMLVIMTDEQHKENEIELFLTAPGYHSREHANLRQAEVIAKEILPALSEEDGSIGIITPYQNNVRLIKEIIRRDDIKVDTIHSFQGREMDTIIFSTSDDIITPFSDSAMLINVAVSRAKNRFILVASSNEQPKNSNIKDLISYISYNNFKSFRSNIISVFDLLYEQSNASRIEFLSKHRRISSYDSENIMFAMMENIISAPEYRKYAFKIACHYPLRYLFRNTEILSEEESLYLSRSGTHVDFLLYRAIGKEPVAAIEVDGFHFHKQTSRQHERDMIKDSIFSKFGLSLLRFQTNGSEEQKRIRDFLNQYING